MTDQPTFADLDYNSKKRKTRREVFLERMERLIPWEQLEKLLRPYYPTAGRGRRPYELSVMLRIHCVQLFYNLSDPGMEDLLYEVESVRRFVGLRLSEALPDETTILHFRHLLERHALGMELFEEINAHLAAQGLQLREGTIMDATLIAAPTSTKNKAKQRDPEMHQTKKGNEWHFGIKAHIGVDAETGMVHRITTTPANAHDITEVQRLLHGKERCVWNLWSQMQRAVAKMFRHTTRSAIMAMILEECICVLKEGGLLAVMFNARSESHWNSLHELRTSKALEYIGSYPMEYSTGSVVQDNRKGGLKTDFVLIYSKHASAEQKNHILKTFSAVHEWTTDYPGRHIG